LAKNCACFITDSLGVRAFWEDHRTVQNGASFYWKRQGLEASQSKS